MRRALMWLGITAILSALIWMGYATDRLTFDTSGDGWTERVVAGKLVGKPNHATKTTSVAYFDLGVGDAFSLAVDTPLLNQIPWDTPVEVIGETRGTNDMPTRIHGFRTSFVGIVHFDEAQDGVSFRPLNQDLGVIVEAFHGNAAVRRSFEKLREEHGGTLEGYTLFLPDAWLEYQASDSGGIFLLRTLKPPQIRAEPGPPIIGAS